MFRAIQNLWNMVFEKQIPWERAVEISKGLDLDLEKIVNEVNSMDFFEEGFEVAGSDRNILTGIFVYASNGQQVRYCVEDYKKFLASTTTVYITLDDPEKGDNLLVDISDTFDRGYVDYLSLQRIHKSPRAHLMQALEIRTPWTKFCKREVGYPITLVMDEDKEEQSFVIEDQGYTKSVSLYVNRRSLSDFQRFYHALRESFHHVIGLDVREIGKE